MIYFIVFGDTTASLIKIFFFPNTENFLTTRSCYVLILAAVLVVPLVQKELKEIKALSVILFIAISTFLTLMIV